VAEFDKVVIDGIIDGLAMLTRMIARLDDLSDRYLVDGVVNGLAAWTYGAGLKLRTAETGRIRQYVMFIVVGTVAMFVLISFYIS
jgi:NADH:ubiquinone oxidoreductase subunit 5 (subunit L)/multisubunit Na+/H+ antiporter MnhA subunit